MTNKSIELDDLFSDNKITLNNNYLQTLNNNNNNNNNNIRVLNIDQVKKNSNIDDIKFNNCNKNQVPIEHTKTIILNDNTFETTKLESSISKIDKELQNIECDKKIKSFVSNLQQQQQQQQQYQQKRKFSEHYLDQSKTFDTKSDTPFTINNKKINDNNFINENLINNNELNNSIADNNLNQNSIKVNLFNILFIFFIFFSFLYPKLLFQMRRHPQIKK